MKRFAIRKAHLVAMLSLSISLLVSGANAADSKPVGLGTAGNFAILSNPVVSTALATNVVNIGVSLIAANEITESSLSADHSNTFSILSLEAEEMSTADNTNQSCPLSKKKNACHTGQ